MADQNNEKTYLSLKGFRVTNVRKLGDKGVISFSLLGNGLGLYNLRIVPSAKGDFVAAPQSAGKDGKYYAQYQIYLKNEDESKLIEVVRSKLPKEEQESADF